ncbi:hypothetical protein VPH35_008182 [Triticum aestivum]
MKECTSLSGKQQAGRRGAGASSSSSHPLPLNGCDLAGADMTKDGEPWAKITGEVRYMDVDFCKGYVTCAYLKWVDKEWQGRPRQVIGKLAEENVALQKFVFDKDAEIMRLREERKAMIMKHKKEIRTRDRREIWLACLVCCSALLYGVVALVIRGFV